jgi:triphosphoribosyl-dephospho-CoA synthase
MAFPLDRATIEAAFLAACRAELEALKPGNVHVHAAGHGMETVHFEQAAAAAVPFLCDPALSVGARILGAVEASFAATGLNTNLGIVLLSAPLAAAADTAGGPPDLQGRLRRVLDRLDVADAELAFRAIVIANPAGLGQADHSDVKRRAQVTLREAMALASDRDRVARAYVTGFDDIFGLALPELHAARTRAREASKCEVESLAITALHMKLLATFPDSHIARKHGRAAAETVQREARDCINLWHPAARPETMKGLLDLDRSLKARGLNPGTTADFVVATLFADGLVHPRATNGHS